MNSEQIEDQKFYTHVWREVLTKVFGYTGPQVDEWIKSNHTEWDEYHAVFVSEFPEYWVLDAVISDAIRQKIGAAQTNRLKRDIVDAIEIGSPKWCSNESYDWAAARERVKNVFAIYNT